MEGLRYQDRKVQRSEYCEVVWLVPKAGKGFDYSQAVPAVSRDLSIQGLSLVHTAPIADAEFVVGIPGKHGFSFFHCHVQHCSDLGYGFFQIGLFAAKVITPNMADMAIWEKRTSAFTQESPPNPWPRPLSLWESPPRPNSRESFRAGPLFHIRERGVHFLS